MTCLEVSGWPDLALFEECLFQCKNLPVLMVLKAAHVNNDQDQKMQ